MLTVRNLNLSIGLNTASGSTNLLSAFVKLPFAGIIMTSKEADTRNIAFLNDTSVFLSQIENIAENLALRAISLYAKSAAAELQNLWEVIAQTFYFQVAIFNLA